MQLKYPTKQVPDKFKRIYLELALFALVSRGVFNGNNVKGPNCVRRSTPATKKGTLRIGSRSTHRQFVASISSHQGDSRDVNGMSGAETVRTEWVVEAAEARVEVNPRASMSRIAKDLEVDDSESNCAPRTSFLDWESLQFSCSVLSFIKVPVDPAMLAALHWSQCRATSTDSSCERTCSAPLRARGLDWRLSTRARRMVKPSLSSAPVTGCKKYFQLLPM